MDFRRQIFVHILDKLGEVDKILQVRVTEKMTPSQFWGDGRAVKGSRL